MKHVATHDAVRVVAVVASIVVIALTVSVGAPARGVTGETVRGLESGRADGQGQLTTYPIAVAGLEKRSDGAITVWLLNIEPQVVNVTGSDIYGVVDVQFTGDAKETFKVKASYNNNCALTKYASSPGSSGSAEKVECLPDLAPGRLIRLVTVASSGPFPKRTLLAGVPSQTAYIGSVILPAKVRTTAKIQKFLQAYATSQRLTNTTVFVTIRKNSPFKYDFSRLSAPPGWVTFVFTNHAVRAKTLEICQYSSVVGSACAGLASDPNEDATALVTTGNSEYFAIYLGPGRVLFHSWNGGLEKGLRGIFTVTRDSKP
jgi:hypothetical protein